MAKPGGRASRTIRAGPKTAHGHRIQIWRSFAFRQQIPPSTVWQPDVGDQNVKGLRPKSSGPCAKAIGRSYGMSRRPQKPLHEVPGVGVIFHHENL